MTEHNIEKTPEKNQQEDATSWIMLTLLASSTALPGKAKLGASLVSEAFHRLETNQWTMNVITGAATLAGGLAAGVAFETGDFFLILWHGVSMSLLIGVMLFGIVFIIALVYEYVHPRSTESSQGGAHLGR